MREVAGVGGAILVEPESVESLTLGLNQALNSTNSNMLKAGIIMQNTLHNFT